MQNSHGLSKVRGYFMPEKGFSYVPVNAPIRGYRIFIENMLDAAE